MQAIHEWFMSIQTDANNESISTQSYVAFSDTYKKDWNQLRESDEETQLLF